MPVKSVTFPKEGKGYIYQKITKPEKPDIYLRGKQKKSEDRYKDELEQYEQDLKYYKKHKGEYVLLCSGNLVDRTFNFEDNKVNIVFGPNGSGKTTLINAISGTALIEDGFSKIYEPIRFKGWFDNTFNIQVLIHELSKNSCIVNWDGNPIYYNNFGHTLANSRGFGEIQGSVLNSIQDEVEFAFFNKSSSAGEKAIYIFNKIVKLVSVQRSLEDIITPKLKCYLNGNKTWQQVGEVQLEYYRKLENFAIQSPVTLLFDEIDKSLDITTVIALYTEIFPIILEKYKGQIITVSHNPLVLSDKIFENPLYNIISLDEGYTEECRRLVKTLF